MKPHHSFRSHEDERTYVHYLTFSCNNCLPLFEDQSLCRLLVEHLNAERNKLGFEVYAYVIMPNHVHLLIWSPSVPTSRVLQGIKGGFSRIAMMRIRERQPDLLPDLTIHRCTRSSSSFWLPGGGFDRPIRGQRAIRMRISYIHNNPVRARLVRYPSVWKWSSERFWSAGDASLMIMDNPPFLL